MNFFIWLHTLVREIPSKRAASDRLPFARFRASIGDHKEAKPVFDLDSVQLIDMAIGLRHGNAIENPPDMSYGAVVNPNFEPLDLQLMKIKKKVDAGAEFFQTQAVYDRRIFETFINKASKLNVPIQVGLVVLKSPQMGKFMNANVSGIEVPHSWIDEIGSVEKEDRKMKAAEMMGLFLAEIKHMVQGVHLMPLGWADIVPKNFANGADCCLIGP